MSVPDAQVRLFGEDLGTEQPLPAVLADVQNRLLALGEKFGPALPADERFEILDETLDELDAALERVRDARAKLLRIELRLVSAYERGIARFREAERDAANGAG